MTPTARSLEVLREMGYAADVVERWIAAARIRKDWGGFGDILAAHPLHGILLVQSCAGASAAAREAKALGSPALNTWKSAGGKAEVWSWALRGARGKRKLWTLTRRTL